jgi:hypothetical protein
MKEMDADQFQNITVEASMERECFWVKGEGNQRIYVVVNPEQAMRDRVEGLCSMIDASRPERALAFAEKLERVSAMKVIEEEKVTVQDEFDPVDIALKAAGINRVLVTTEGSTNAT